MSSYQFIRPPSEQCYPFMLVTLTIVAHPPKLKLVMVNLKSCFACDSSIQLWVYRLINIKYAVALLTTKMVVPFLFDLESANGAIKVQF